MTVQPFRTVLIGMGKVGAGYAEDPVMARYYPYATHAQVLADHPAFAWEAVVDVAAKGLQVAQTRWNITHAVPTVSELVLRYQPEVAVIATPPEMRIPILEQLPTVRAILVEKPLGVTLADSQQFLTWCQERHILVQVNLWRRADQQFRALAAGQLTELVGQPQAAFGLYGNGVLNNGTHLVDFVRLLLGEIDAVQTVTGVTPYREGPIPGDVNLPFCLRLHSGLTVMMQPVAFQHYRENGLEIWGDQGRFSILQEGLGLASYPCQPNRGMQAEREIASDQPRVLTSTVGHAFYHLYENLANALQGCDRLWSPGSSALQTMRVVQAILESERQAGRSIPVNPPPMAQADH